jgi:hypothetical protein
MCEVESTKDVSLSINEVICNRGSPRNRGSLWE